MDIFKVSKQTLYHQRKIQSRKQDGKKISPCSPSFFDGKGFDTQTFSYPKQEFHIDAVKSKPFRSLSSQQATRHFGLSPCGMDFEESFVASYAEMPSVVLYIYTLLHLLKMLEDKLAT